MTKLSEINENIEMIFQAIEDNDGELTPELEQMLTVSKDELEEKLHHYADAILQWEGDVTVVKNKIKMLQQKVKAKENRIDNLKQYSIFAVNTYGKLNKSSNHYIEFPDLKLAVRPSQSVDFDEARVALLLDLFRSYTKELYVNGILETGDELDVEGILEGINALGKANHDCFITDKEFVPFTYDDLKSLRVNLIFNYTINDLITLSTFLLKAMHNANEDNVSLESAKDKTYMKACLGQEYNCTLATIKEKENLTIK